ncbi:MAG: CHAT domain-containing protein [Planctomycetota bacterium]
MIRRSCRHVVATLACGLAAQAPAPDTPGQRFERLTASYRTADTAAARTIEAELEALYRTLAVADADERRRDARWLVDLCAWFVYDRRPSGPPRDRDAWLGRAAAAARHAGSLDYALQFEIERVKVWLVAGEPARARERLDACAADAAAARSIGKLLYLVYRSKLLRAEDPGAARVELARAEGVLEDLAEASLSGPRLAEAKCWVHGEQVETAIAAGLLHEAFTAAEQERAAALAADDPAAVLKADMHAVKLDIAALRPETAAVRCDEYVDRTDLDPTDRAFFLLHRAVSHVQRVRSDPAHLERALADLQKSFATGAVVGSEAVSWRIREADYLARAGHDAEALAALQAIDPAAVGALPPKEEAYYHGLRSFLASAAPASTPDALRADLERAADRLLDAWRRLPRQGASSYLEYGQDRLLLTELIRAQLRGAAVATGPAAERALRTAVEAQCMSSLARRHDIRPPALGDVRAALVPRDGGLLVYSFGRERGHVFAVDATGVTCATLEDGDTAIHRALDHAMLCMATPVRAKHVEPAFAAVARSLLPDPIDARIGVWRRATVVGLGELGHVPFAWLRRANGQRVLETCAVAHLPSIPAGMIAAVSTPVAAGSARVAVLTAPAPAAVAQAQFGPLAAFPEADHAAAWRRRLTPLPVVVASAEQATLDRLTEAPWAGARALVAVCHGVIEPDGVALMWAPGARHDGVLRAADLRALGRDHDKPLPPLVCWLSCNASLAPVRRGEFGSHDLAGACLEAGARAVVVSPQELGYAFAQRFATELFAALREPGASPAGALRALQRAAARDDNRLSLLHVVGLGHDPWAR